MPDISEWIEDSEPPVKQSFTSVNYDSIVDKLNILVDDAVSSSSSPSRAEAIQKCISEVGSFSNAPLPPGLEELLSHLLARIPESLGRSSADKERQDLMRLWTSAVSVGPVDGCFTRWQDAVLNILKELAVPQSFGHQSDGEPSEDIRRFREVSHYLVEALGLALKATPEQGASDEVVYHLLVVCAAFLGDEEDRWSSAGLRKHLEDILQFTVQDLSKSRRITLSVNALVYRHAERILSENVRPFFMHSEVDPGGNRTEERKRIKGSEWKADTVYDAQPWKEKRPDCVQVLTWVVLHIEHGQWGPLQHHLFPPLLTLLDDYEPRYKTVGAHLVRHAIVKNCSPMDVRRTGLGDVFFDALLPLLTYHSELELLKEALPCIVELVPVLEPKDSRPYYSKLERILQDGILLGLSFAIGGKIETIRVILSAIPPLISLLGLASVRFMKRLLGVSCDVLELHVHDVPTQIIAAQVIVRIETECWPRMAVYRGMTMKAAATAWRGAKDNDSADADTLRVLLKSIVSALKEICGELVEPDLRLLRRIDPRMFEDLIPL